MSEVPERIPIIAKRGIFLPECGLWLDPWDRQEIAFVSHAHSDHFGTHGTIIASKGTAALIEARFRGAYTLEPRLFGRAWHWRDHRLVLLPAGHTLGSAQIHITRLRDGASLLYTGDFKIRRSRTSEPARFAEADTLIMETTFGLPHYRFPSTTRTRNALIRFCRECLEENETPVLAAYALGKAQEVMAQLAGAGLSFALHSAVFAMTEAYAAQGVAFPPYTRLTPESDLTGHVLVVPPSAVRSQVVRKIRNRRVAMCTGWALTPGAKFRYQVDEVFPLSDHADYAELLACVEQVKPKLTLTTHGYAAEFARDLRERGWEAWSLGADDQMEFSFGLSPEATASAGFDETDADEDSGGTTEPEKPADAYPATEFGRFVQTCDAIAAASSRLRKIELLAGYLRGLATAEKAAAAARYFSGRAAATREEQKRLATGWAIIRLALLDATGVGIKRYREISASQADSGRTAYLMLLHGQKRCARDISLADLATCFQRLTAARGPLAKAAVLAASLRQMSPAEGQYLVKILTGDMRIGLKDGLIEEAIALAFSANASAVREASMLTGDLGETARLASRGELHLARLVPFQPLLPMLASPEESSASLWQRLTSGGASPTPPAVWLEDKYDGIRAQLHKHGPRVDVYSRDLRSLAEEFPDITGPAAHLPGDVVFDGEIIAFAEGRKLDFRSLQKRLGRREPDLFMADEVPVRFVVFDLLWLNGQPLLSLPLHERRALLETLALRPPFEMIPRHAAASALEVEAAFLAARQRGNEGLIAKDPASPYTAGRRGKTWLKLKKAFSTLDCVVVAAEQGHGKRSHVLSDYTFAVRDERDGSLKIIGKAYSGLTDAEIEELTAHFIEHTLDETRRARRVTPNIVLEIAFDAIHPSTRHRSGLALRFPRIKAIRRDKTAADIDTLATAQLLAGITDTPSVNGPHPEKPGICAK